MSTSTAPAVRCPRCSAMLRAGTEWCSLCYADLRHRPEAAVPPPAAADVLRPATVSQPPEQPHVGLPSPAEPQPRRSGGKHAKKPEFGAVTAPPPDEVERLADQLMAELAATEGGNPLGAASGLVDSAGKRVALMVGGALGILVLIVVLMLVAGALL